VDKMGLPTRALRGGKITVVMTPGLHRLHPSPTAPTTIEAAYSVARPSPAERPWIGLCMVTSLDGSVSIDGTSGGLGNINDLNVLLTLRDIADMVLVGAGTARGEGYGPPRLPGKRIGIVTNSGNVDLGTELFTTGAGFLIAPETAEIDESRVEVLRAGEQAVDLPLAVARLRQVMPSVRYVQAEGGPRLNGALLAADLIDELDLSLSPRLVGGNGPRLTAAAPELERRFELSHVLADEQSFLFTRWVRRTD
jgi:riboflavin biosynthesis pyrimidine reductase